ncbi:hypothetical protein SETIT_4G274800v2 [Setaria italica]|uniref:Uncharacterized protein n=1 Tax=Setaria italica TaxID=4555 RepID=K3Y194_SETIT|nr:hypothetical protein SETIT_4G274800v2 [Setaria italica]
MESNLLSPSLPTSLFLRTIESYAVSGRHILLSAAAGCPVAGTVAFDASAEEWHFVDRERSLPFVGEAVPYGRLFLGRSRSKDSKDLTAYDIAVTKKGTDRTLAIVEVPLTFVMAGDSPVMSGQFFSCLGNGVVCAMGCLTEGTSRDVEIDDDELYIHLYSPVSAEEGEAEAQQGVTVLSSKGSRYHLRLHEPLCRLVAPTLVAAPCVAI